VPAVDRPGVPRIWRRDRRHATVSRPSSRRGLHREPPILTCVSRRALRTRWGSTT